MYKIFTKLLFSLFPPKSKVSRLEKTINYRFQNQELLINALSHRSYINSVKKMPAFESNERLEFLGDAVLDLVITEHLYKKYSRDDEGKLSKMKSLIVSAKVLEVCAKSWDLGAFVLLSHSEKNAGGGERQSILSDTFEAVLGAIYLDGGLGPARKALETSVISIIDDVLADASFINYKSELLELAQSLGLGTPSYRIIEEWGPEHDKRFCMGAFIQGEEWGRGEGSTKKSAEQTAGRVSIERYQQKETDKNNDNEGER